MRIFLRITAVAGAVTAFLAIAPASVAQSKLVVPAESGLNLPAQPVGPDDLLAVSVYGAPELSRTQRVSPDGTLRIPMLKQTLAVRGRMPVEIERLVSAALVEEGILVDPVVSVSLAEVASRPVSVAGAVRRPVIFQATGRTTLLDAITQAEGLSTEAGQEILVTRPAEPGTAQVIERISVEDLIERGKPEANLLLAGGEEIRVPEVGRVFVVGNVLKPGALPLSDADGMTVLKAVAMSEGLARFATKQAYIYRPSADGGEKQEIEVELRKIMDRKNPDVDLLAGDIFYIPDNRKSRMTANIIDTIVGFGAGTASGVLVYSAR